MKIKKTIKKVVESPLWSQNWKEVLEKFPQSVSNPKLQMWLYELSGLFQPLWIASRIRILKWNQEAIEMSLPFSSHNQNKEGEMEECLLVLASSRAVKLLIQKNPHVESVVLKNFEYENYKTMKGRIWLRLEWSFLEQQSLKAQLNNNKSALQTLVAQFYDREDQKVAQLTLHCEVRGLSVIGVQQ